MTTKSVSALARTHAESGMSEMLNASASASAVLWNGSIANPIDAILAMLLLVKLLNWYPFLLLCFQTALNSEQVLKN
jgi:hypothetical protein